MAGTLAKAWPGGGSAYLARHKHGRITFATARWGRRFALFLLFLLVPGADVLAQALAGWSVVSTAGEARYRETATNDWRPVVPGIVLAEGSRVVTGAQGQVILSRGTSTVTVAAQSETEVGGARGGAVQQFLQYLGTILLRIENGPDRNFQVRTPYLAATVKGTVFSVSVDARSAAVHVTEGLVEVAALSSGSTVLVRPGQTARVSNAPNAPVEFIGSGPGGGGRPGSPRPQGGEDTAPDRDQRKASHVEAAEHAGNGRDATREAGDDDHRGPDGKRGHRAERSADDRRDAQRRSRRPDERESPRRAPSLAIHADDVKKMKGRNRGQSRRADKAHGKPADAGDVQVFRISVPVGTGSVDPVKASGGLIAGPSASPAVYAPSSNSGNNPGSGGGQSGSGPSGSGVASVGSDAGSIASTPGVGSDNVSTSSGGPGSGGTVPSLSNKIEVDSPGKSEKNRDRDRGRGKGKDK